MEKCNWSENRVWWLHCGKDRTGPFSTRKEAVAFAKSAEGKRELPPEGKWEPRKSS
jgi:hypothetical protein